MRDSYRGPAGKERRGRPSQIRR